MPPHFKKFFKAATGNSEEKAALISALVADGLSIQDRFKPEPTYKQTGKGYYQSDTVNEIQQAKKQKAGETQL